MNTGAGLVKHTLLLSAFLCAIVFAGCSAEVPDIATVEGEANHQHEAEKNESTLTEDAISGDANNDNTKNDDGIEENQDKTEPSYIIHNSVDYIGFGDLRSMTDAVDAIVIGRYKEFLTSYNASREDDGRMPSQVRYSEGRVFSFQVDTVIKGDIFENQIAIVLIYSERKEGRFPITTIDAVSGMEVETGEFDYYSFESVYDFYIEPDYDETVMLFLGVNEMIEEELTFPFDKLFFLYGMPSMISLKPGGEVQLEANSLDTPERLQYVAAREPAVFKSEGGRTVFYHEGFCRVITEDFLSGYTLEQLLNEIRESPSVDDGLDVEGIVRSVEARLWSTD